MTAGAAIQGKRASSGKALEENRSGFTWQVGAWQKRAHIACMAPDGERD